MRIFELLLLGAGGVSAAYWSVISVGGVLYTFRPDKVVPIWTQYQKASGAWKVALGYLLYSVNNLLAADRAFNALRGGDPNETFSGAMGKAVEEGHCRLCKVFCRLLTIIDRRADGRDHCAAAVDRRVGNGSGWDRRVHR